MNYEREQLLRGFRGCWVMEKALFDTHSPTLGLARRLAVLECAYPHDEGPIYWTLLETSSVTLRIPERFTRWTKIDRDGCSTHAYAFAQFLSDSQYRNVHLTKYSQNRREAHSRVPSWPSSWNIGCCSLASVFKSVALFTTIAFISDTTIRPIIRISADCITVAAFPVSPRRLCGHRIRVPSEAS
ncbi:hypothetical protein BC629DRAFT_3785 [Irpex lacteus]|nr:hypothetical protein BC629DRAFT_3785 [Irpex lacteus]